MGVIKAVVGVGEKDLLEQPTGLPGRDVQGKSLAWVRVGREQECAAMVLAKGGVTGRAQSICCHPGRADITPCSSLRKMTQSEEEQEVCRGRKAGREPCGK